MWAGSLNLPQSVDKPIEAGFLPQVLVTATPVQYPVFPCMWVQRPLMAIPSPTMGLPVWSPAFPWTWERVSIIVPRLLSRIAVMIRDLQIVLQVRLLIIVVYRLG